MSIIPGLSIDPKKTRAILIGNSKFPRDENNLPAIPAVENNINDFRNILSDNQIVGIPEKNITQILNEKSPIKVAEKLAQVSEEAEDTLIVYYTGHGLIGSSSTSELLLSVGDTTFKGATYNALSFEKVKEAIRGSYAERKILIVDCCFSGLALPILGNEGSVLRAKIDIKGTYAIAASPSNEPAKAPPGDQYTAFSGELIKIFQTGLDTQSQVITLEEIYEQLKRELSRAGFPEPQQANRQDGNKIAIAWNQGVKAPLLEHFDPKIISSKTIILGDSDDPEIREYRIAAKQCIVENFDSKWNILDRQDLCSGTSPSAKICRDAVSACGLYAVILGNFYGGVYDDEDIGYTEYEFKIAESKNRPIVVFILSDEERNINAPVDFIKKQILLINRQEEFRNYIEAKKSKIAIRYVSDLDDFRKVFCDYIDELECKKEQVLFEGGDFLLHLQRAPFLGKPIDENSSYDRCPVLLYQLKDLDNLLINEFLEQPAARDELRQAKLLQGSVSERLHQFSCSVDGYPTLGAFLCFAPCELLANKFAACSLHMSVYSDMNRGLSAASPRMAIDNLLNLYKIGMDFLLDKAGLQRTGRIGTNIRDDLEVPELALREVLANALVHRDYEDPTLKEQPTRIEVYTDRVEITSFGSLPQGISIEALNQKPEGLTPIRRNNVIAEIFRIMQRAELNASGISRIHELTQNANLAKPVIELTEIPTVKVILYRPIQEILYRPIQQKIEPQNISFSSVQVVLHISLKPIGSDWVELRYRHQSRPYESLRLQLSKIQKLINQGDLYYYARSLDLKQVGEVLFRWLDGDTRWLSQAIKMCPPTGLVLAIAAEERLALLPWEVLHDGGGFLVERMGPPIVPLRWVEQEAETHLPVQSLQVLFMAASPEGVQPVLDFEQEEAEILKITEELPLTLRVEESGCVEELGKLWRSYSKDTFTIFHLTGHASIQRNELHHPYFITETLTGERHEATAEELIQSFGTRFPRLVFLSTSQTAQSEDEGTVIGSMAETLVRQGIPAVLGWDGLVHNSTAIAAAAHLYERLAEGYSIAQALGSTYYHLRKEKMPGWHLLRLYARSQAWGVLAEEPGDYIPFSEPVQAQFLDSESRVRVATAQEFVGRRRLIQRCLRQLRSRGCLGLILHGLGGVGKSTVAARLLERLTDYTPIVIYRFLDVQKLERLLAEQCLSEAGHAVLQSGLPIVQRLTKFLEVGLNQVDQKFCFVLDDFEANLEARSDGRQELQAHVVESLTALLFAVARSRSGHRVILTSRYDTTLPELDRRLHREPLAALRGADLKKKYDRLEAFQLQSSVNVELQTRGKAIADGNPRLLEWLNHVLLAAGLDTEQILTRMAAEEMRFREDILANELLKQQADELVDMLSRMQVFELPVPQAAISAVCSDISEWERHCQRAVALGLLEVSQFQGTISYRAPKILTALLSPINRSDLFQTAAEVLYQLWWLQAETANEEQCLEMYRLAMVAESEEIAIDIANALVSRWKTQGRYREAIPLYIETLGMSKRLLGESHPDMVQSLNNLADLYRLQGRYEEAEPLYVEALGMSKRLLGESHPDVARSLNSLAMLYDSQGRYEEAEPLLVEALGMSKRLLGESHPDVARSLNSLAMLYDSQGRYEEAEPLLVEALGMSKRLLGESHPDVADTLWNLGVMRYQQQQFAEAEALLLEALPIYRQALGENHPNTQSLRSWLKKVQDAFGSDA